MRAALVALTVLAILPAGGATMGFSISSPAFADHAPIPLAHTCDGGGASPPLDITGAPAGTTAFALVVHDPDAPIPLIVATINDYTHWLTWNVPVDASGAAHLAAGAPSGGAQGRNSAGTPGWTPPCPPPGSPPHRYVFVATALDATLTLPLNAQRETVDAAVAAHALASATLTGCHMRIVGAPACPT